MKKFPIWIVNSLEYDDNGDVSGEVLALFTQDGEAEEYIKPLKDECYAVWIEKHEVPASFFITKDLIQKVQDA